MTVYEQHESSFKKVTAYALIKEDGSQLGTIAFKFPQDGAGRLLCYLHIHGLEMVRGYAGGGGYDKKSAAAAHAASKLKFNPHKDMQDAQRVKDALIKGHNGGYNWSRELENEGFRVYQAV